MNWRAQQGNGSSQTKAKAPQNVLQKGRRGRQKAEGKQQGAA